MKSLVRSASAAVVVSLSFVALADEPGVAPAAPAVAPSPSGSAETAPPVALPAPQPVPYAAPPSGGYPPAPPEVVVPPGQAEEGAELVPWDHHGARYAADDEADAAGESTPEDESAAGDAASSDDVGEDADGSDSGLAHRPAAKHAVYAELSTLVFAGAAGVSYAYRPYRGFAVSAGVGTGYVVAPGAGPGAAVVSGQLMAHGLFGDIGASSFEIALGASPFVNIARGKAFSSPVLPSAFLGYRYQPLDGGFLFRSGFAWTFATGVGLDLSFGYGF